MSWDNTGVVYDLIYYIYVQPVQVETYSYYIFHRRIGKKKVKYEFFAIPELRNVGTLELKV